MLMVWPMWETFLCFWTVVRAEHLEKVTDPSMPGLDDMITKQLRTFET